MAVKSTLLDWDEDLPAHIHQGSVIHRADAGYCLEATALLKGARQRSEEIIELAQAEFEKQKALGFEKGLEEGRQQAARHHLKTILTTIDYYEKSRLDLVDVVLTCLRSLVLELPPEERIYQLVGQALDALKQQSHIILRMNPQDRESAEAALERLRPLLSSGSKLEVRVRDDLEPGCCVLESPLGLVDASLESQLSILAESLHSAAAR